MLVKIRKTGNSLALTIPQDLASDLNLKEGDMVNIENKSGEVAIRKVDIIPSLEPEIEQIAEKGIQQFRHDMDKLAG